MVANTGFMHKNESKSTDLTFKGGCSVSKGAKESIKLAPNGPLESLPQASTLTGIVNVPESIINQFEESKFQRYNAQMNPKKYSIFSHIVCIEWLKSDLIREPTSISRTRS